MSLTLVVTELASVISRRREVVGGIACKLDLNEEEAVLAVLLYILKRFDLRHRSVQGHARIPFAGQRP